MSPQADNLRAGALSLTQRLFGRRETSIVTPARRSEELQRIAEDFLVASRQAEQHGGSSVGRAGTHMSTAVSKNAASQIDAQPAPTRSPTMQPVPDEVEPAMPLIPPATQTPRKSTISDVVSPEPSVSESQPATSPSELPQELVDAMQSLDDPAQEQLSNSTSTASYRHEVNRTDRTEPAARPAQQSPDSEPPVVPVSGKRDLRPIQSRLIHQVLKELVRRDIARRRFDTD